MEAPVCKVGRPRFFTAEEHREHKLESMRRWRSLSEENLHTYSAAGNI